MTSVRRVALSLFLAAGAASVVAAPALAKKQEAGPAAAIGKDERTALSTLKAALDANDYPAATRALSNAQAVVRSSEGRFYLAALQLEVARGTNNLPLLTTATDTLVSSGRLSQAELGQLYASQGAVAAFAGDRQRSEAAYSRAMELAPSADIAINLAQVKINQRRNPEAVALIERAIGMRRAAGQMVPESWYRRAVFLAVTDKLGPQALKDSRDWVAAYPTSENWRDALLTYRDYARPDAAATVDAIRLARLSKALAGERDYLEAANAFSQAGLPGEAKSVFEEGVAGGMVDPAKASFKEAVTAANRGAATARTRLASLRTSGASAATGEAALGAADQLLSFADYAGAAQLYQSALLKGGADADTINTRLGIALALGGRRAEAESAFRAVTGPRSDLAALWLAWLAQRG